MEVSKEDQVKALIDKLIIQLCLDNCDVRINSATNPGDNWVGEVYRISITGYNKSKEKVQLPLFLKKAPSDLTYRDLLNAASLYQREIYFYTKVLPELIALQMEKRVKVLFQPFPKYYISSLKCLEEAIIMEDLSVKKFITGNHRRPIDYQTASLVVTELAKLHALSFALKKEKPHVYNEIKSNLQENFFSNPSVSRMAIKVVLDLCQQILANCEPCDTSIKTSIQQFASKLPLFFRTIVLAEESERYGAISHSDTQIRNFMVKYGIGSNSDKPEECYLIDLQLARIASPAFDLLFFLFISSDKQFRRLHYENVIKDYYNSFSLFLKELGGDPEESLPFDVLQGHLKKFAPFGLYVAVWIVALNHKTSDEVPKEDQYSEEDFTKNLATVSNKLYFTRIKDLVLDMIDYEYSFVY